MGVLVVKLIVFYEINVGVPFISLFRATLWSHLVYRQIELHIHQFPLAFFSRNDLYGNIIAVKFLCVLKQPKASRILILRLSEFLYLVSMGLIT